MYRSICTVRSESSFPLPPVTPFIDPYLMSSEGRVDSTELNVRVRNRRAGILALDCGRGTRVRGARTTRSTRSRIAGGCGVGRVEPKHVDGVVVPERHDENHTTAHGGAHGR